MVSGVTQFRFLDWSVYRDSQKLFKDVLAMTRSFPQEYRFNFGNQIVRSSLSVILNIAEGSGKHSDRELNRFVEIALGSLYETLAHADTMRECGIISVEQLSCL